MQKNTKIINIRINTTKKFTGIPAVLQMHLFFYSLICGWIGGFARSNPAFAYPNPDLSSLPMSDHMANIDLLQRQQAAYLAWIQWESQKGNKDPKRVFQMFAPDISRLAPTFSLVPGVRNAFYQITYWKSKRYIDRWYWTSNLNLLMLTTNQNP